MNEYKVSEAGVFFWDLGQLIWDDYLTHRQIALTRHVDNLIPAFSDWRTVESALDIIKTDKEKAETTDLVTKLIAAEVLISKDSKRAQVEDKLRADWGTWGSQARYFHFATRSLKDTPAETPEDTKEWLKENLEFRPSPPFSKNNLTGDEIFLMDPSDAGEPPHKMTELMQIISDRRTCRDYSTRDSLSISNVSLLLKSILGVRLAEPDPENFSTLVKKTVPSAGARHPSEIYLAVRDVDGLAPGIYHYCSFSHKLTSIRTGWTSEDSKSIGVGQEWLGDAQAIIFYTAVIERTQWKYIEPRGYRFLFVELGHLSQNAYLAGTALGLGVGFVGAIRDEVVEDFLSIDGSSEVVLGCSPVGVPNSR